MPARRFGWLKWCAFGFGGLVVLTVALLGTFFWVLQKDQNSAFLREKLLSALNQGLGAGHDVALAEAGLRFAGLTSTFSVGGLAVTNAGTGAEASLEQAQVEVSTMSLWRRTPVAHSVRVKGVKLVLPEPAQAANPLAAHEALAIFRAVLAGAHFAGSGTDPTFRTLDSITGSDIAIYQRQPGGSIIPVQRGLKVDIERAGQGLVARLSKDGSPAALTLKAENRPLSDGGTMMVLESDELDFRAAEALVATGLPGLDPKLKMRMTLHSRVAADGTLVEKGARVNLYGGVITPPDRDMTPFLLDEASLEMRMRPDSPEVFLDRIRIRFNETHLVFVGSIAPEAAPGTGLRLKLRSERADIDRLSPGEAPIALDSAELDAVISPNLRSLRLERFEVREDEGQATLTGIFSAEDGGIVENHLKAANLNVRKALRIWPVWVAASVRHWLIDHAESGTLVDLKLDSKLVGAAIADAQAHRPVPDESVHVEYRLEGVTLRPLRDAPPLLAVNGRGIATGRHAEAVIDSAVVEPKPGQRFTIRDAKLMVADTTKRPAQMDLTIPAEGRLDALMALLSSPSLREVSGLPSDAAVSDGQFQGLATISLPLAPQIQGKDIRSDFRADLRQVAIDNLVKSERLEGGTFTLQSRNGHLMIKGDGRLFGVPHQIEVKAEPGKPGQAIAKATIDDVLLARRGFDLRPSVQGPMQATMTLPLSRQAQSFDVEIDLARTRIETGIPGLSKRAGQPGRTKFTVLTRPEGTVFDNLELDLAPASLRGRIDLARDGQFVKADLSTFKLSAGDNARLLAERQRGVTRLVLRGNAFDLRPFLRGFQAGKIEDGRQGDATAKAPDFDLDLQSTVLIGFNGELMSGVETRVSRRQGRVTQLALKGQFGGAPVMATSSEGQRDTTLLNATAQDGGALLRFLDIYGKVQGGRLLAEIYVGAQTQQGVVQIRDFTIRGESALRQVGASGKTISATQDMGEEVAFTKMRADFARRPGRLDLREAVMWGNQLGGTLEGSLDYAGDKVDLKGVFVPAYALNNFFASVPLLGPILGGAQYEGLFAVPFVITGRASAPVMRINPVSAIAPGFLRKLFEIQRETGGARPNPNRAN